MPQVPSTLLSEILTQSVVETYISGNSVSSVEEFIAALPQLYKRHFVTVFESKSPTKDYISGVHPRVVSWGATADFILTWTTDPDNPGKDQVEFLQADPDNGKWIAGLIDFSNSTPSISNPTTCQPCHSSINRPIWGSFGVWEGTEDPHDGKNIRQAEVYSGALFHYMNPRVRLLEYERYKDATIQLRRFFLNRSSNIDHLIQPNWEFSTLLSLRHGEVLFQKLKSRTNYNEIVKASLCGETSFHVFSYFTEQHSNMRKISGTSEIVQGINLSTRLSRGDSGGSVHAAIMFLMLHDLYNNNQDVRSLYNSTYNTIGNVYADDPTGIKLIYYPVGEETAAREMLKLYETLYTTKGQSSLNTRLEYKVTPRYVWNGQGSHHATFKERICNLLSSDATIFPPVSPGSQ